MENERRYFWCDPPSPLHSVLESAKEKRAAAIQSIRDLAKSLGGTGSFADNRDGFVLGFVFAEPPNPSAWKHAGTFDNGAKYYVPTKRSKEGRELAARMSRRWYSTISDELVSASGMNRDVIQGHYFCHSGAGYKDDRIYIAVPSGDAGVGGDRFPKIPNYMTECKEWEMQRWFDLGREGCAS
jgi:hypothetical protein